MNLVRTGASAIRVGSSPLQEEVELRRAIREARREFSAEHPNTALAHLQLGDYFSHEQRYTDAEAAYQQAIQIYEALGTGHELLLAMALRSQSQTVCAQERHDDGNSLSARATKLIINFQ
jgi:cytochrome c-type biogenesis protein CcmH/NrfG